MRLLLTVLGFGLVAVAMTDALWTTLWLVGHGGPIVGRFTRAQHRLLMRLAGAGGPDGARHVNHRLLSFQGPIARLGSVLIWLALLWAGWTLVLSADPMRVIASETRTPATFPQRVYFVGYTLFTMGNGEYIPQGSVWQILTALGSAGWSSS